MAGFGEYLRSHREQSGLTLDEIAEITRISPAQLTALEEECFELLPGGVFNVSFARQFARVVGADEEQAAQMLKAATNTTPDLPFADTLEERRDPFLPDGPASRLAEILGGYLRENGGTLTTVGVGALLLIGGFYSYEAWEQKRETDRVEAARLAEVVEETKAAEEAVIPAKLTPEPAPAKPAAPIDLHLEVLDTVWIRVAADGKRVLEGIYSAGPLEPIRANDAVTMKVGNAGGVKLQLNGKDVPPIGPRGHVRSLRVTPEGIEITGGTPPLKPAAPMPRVPTTTASLRWAELAFSNPVR